MIRENKLGKAPYPAGMGALRDRRGWGLPRFTSFGDGGIAAEGDCPFLWSLLSSTSAGDRSHSLPSPSVLLDSMSDYSRIHLTSGVQVTLRQSAEQTLVDLDHAAQFVPFTTIDGRMAVVSPSHVTCVVSLTQEEIDHEAEALRLQHDAVEELRQIHEMP